MTDLPEPLTPADCDLRGMTFLPLDIVRLFDSDFYAISTGDEFKAGLTLWCKSFLQVPAASLPDDDRVLAHLSCAGTGWATVRAMALRGWVKCSDGRLYHPIVATKACEAWAQRMAYRKRTELATAARKAQRERDVVHSTERNVERDEQRNVERNVDRDVVHDAERHVHQVQGDSGQGRVERKEARPIASQSPSARAEARPIGADRAFAEFWAEYPRKTAKDEARKAYAKAARRAAPADILAGLRRQRWPDDPKFIPHPATWLNRGQWQDNPNATVPPPPDDADLYAAIGAKPPARAAPFDGPTIDADPLPLWTPT